MAERSIEEQQDILRKIGKCGSRHPAGYLCTISANHYPSKHVAQVLGGAKDGELIAEWKW